MSHDNWQLVFNGVPYPAPTTYKVDYEPIVKSERNANGDMILEYVNEKRKVNLAWQRLTGEQYQNILQSRKGINITGTLTFFDPSENSIQETTAYASPMSAALLRFEDGMQYWDNVAVNFIEM